MYNTICWLRLTSHTQTSPDASRAIDEHDRTYKESLYSTYPYLTYSNKKPSSPVMKKHSMLGYREKINIKALLLSVVAKSSVEKSFPLNA